MKTPHRHFKITARTSLTTSNFTLSRIIFSIIFMLALSSAQLNKAHAGGFINVDSRENPSGVPLVWGGNTISWRADSGPLSNSVDNEKALLWVEEAFNKWQNVTIKNADGTAINTVNFSNIFLGKTDDDIVASNFQNFVNENQSTVIVFDQDGSIFEANGLDKNSHVGLTMHLGFDENNNQLSMGTIVFNGLMLDNGSLSPDLETAKKIYQATVVHEVGHLLNLDHGQTNLDIAESCDLGGDCSNEQFIPAMFPILKAHLQEFLARDDKAVMSALYSNEAFLENFCLIKGKVEDAGYNPLRGVNVVASRVNDGEPLTRSDSRAFVSGALFPGCHPDSEYILAAIVPGKEYQVTFEPLFGSEGASGFEPLPDPPADFAPGNILGPNGGTTVSCDVGGQTIVMQTVQIATANPCSFVRGGSGSTPPGQPAADSGGSCALIKSQEGLTAQPSAFLIPVFLLLLPGIFLRSRRSCGLNQ